MNSFALCEGASHLRIAQLNYFYAQVIFLYPKKTFSIAVSNNVIEFKLYMVAPTNFQNKFCTVFIYRTKQIDRVNLV